MWVRKYNLTRELKLCSLQRFIEASCSVLVKALCYKPESREFEMR
jgi:hypothetical protein